MPREKVNGVELAYEWAGAGPGAGHAVVIEQPGAVWAAIEPFLSKGVSHGR